MSEIVLPPEIEAALHRSPEMVAMRDAFLKAFVSASPLLVRLRDGGAPEAVVIDPEDFFL